jgi:hypothetical protein
MPSGKQRLHVQRPPEPDRPADRVIIGVLWAPLHRKVHWNPGFRVIAAIHLLWALGDLDPRLHPRRGGDRDSGPFDSRSVDGQARQELNRRLDRDRWYEFDHKMDTMNLRLTLSVPRFASSEPKRRWSMGS